MWNQQRTRLLISNFRRVLKVVVFQLGESPASEFCADVSKHSVQSSRVVLTYEDESVFRNVGTKNSDAGESPKRKTTTFRTRSLGKSLQGPSFRYLYEQIWHCQQLTRYKNSLCSSTNIIRVMDDDADPSGRSLAGTVG